MTRKQIRELVRSRMEGFYVRQKARDGLRAYECRRRIVRWECHRGALRDLGSARAWISDKGIAVREEGVYGCTILHIPGFTLYYRPDGKIDLRDPYRSTWKSPTHPDLLATVTPITEYGFIQNDARPFDSLDW